MASKRHGRNQQRERLRDISTNDQTAIADAVAIRVEEAVDASDLDAKTFALVNIAALWPPAAMRPLTFSTSPRRLTQEPASTR
jgi:hypothetical protein